MIEVQCAGVPPYFLAWVNMPLTPQKNGLQFFSLKFYITIATYNFLLRSHSPL